METVDLSSNRISGGASSYGGPQVVQSSFHGPVNFSHSANHTLPDLASTLPRTVNRRLYTGRKEIADRLADAFYADTALEDKGVKVFVIVGLGGTGKSEICLKFAEDNIDRYWGRFWIDCSDPKTANESYKKLSQQCNWTVSEVDEIRWKLSSCSQRWLLILDNADEPNMDLQDYIPAGGRGNVIVTSRNAECSEHATIGTEILEGLDNKLSEELLLKVAGIQIPANPALLQAATSIVKLLDHHTLALVQAGSYVKSGLCTLAKYPMLYSQQKKELMNYTKQQQKSSYNNVFATFEVSAKWLEREAASESDDAQSSCDALHLLHMLSFMSRDGNMQLIFAEAAQYADKILKAASKSGGEERSELGLTSYHAEKLPAFAPQKWRGAAGHLRWRKACNMLKRFSLVTIKSSDLDEDLSLHPLVHEWAKERQDPNLQQQVWISTTCVLGLACAGNFSYTPIFETIQRHTRSCVSQDHIQEYICKMSGFAAWQIAYQLVWVAYITGEDRIPVILLPLMQGLIQKESEDNSMRIATEYCFALLKRYTGELTEAVKLLEHVVQVEELKLDEAHPHRLESEYQLAVAYRTIGQITDAIKILEHIVQVRTRLDEAHPDRLASEHQLAMVYQKNGQIADAIKILEHIVQVQTRLDEAHPDRLMSENDLAIAYRENGQITDAITIREHFVQVETRLDKTHPDRLRSQQVLALAYIDDGQAQRAINILDQVVRTSELKFGINHHFTESFRKSLQFARCKASGME